LRLSTWACRDADSRNVRFFQCCGRRARHLFALQSDHLHRFGKGLLVGFEPFGNLLGCRAAGTLPLRIRFSRTDGLLTVMSSPARTTGDASSGSVCLRPVNKP
jgi:hypothetical protein